ncbi:MAG: hypothetical protein ACRDQ5_16455 [Sciscionella sp.]
MARIREEIGKVKTRYGNVGAQSPAEDGLDHRMFGQYEDGRDPSGMGGATKGFVSAVSRQYRHAEALLDSVERAMDATERGKWNTEDTNTKSLEA